MKDVMIKQLSSGTLMVTVQREVDVQNFICDWIRDTGKSLELVRWSREPEGNIRKDTSGRNIEIVVKTILKENATDIQGLEHITRL